MVRERASIPMAGLPELRVAIDLTTFRGQHPDVTRCHPLAGVAGEFTLPFCHLCPHDVRTVNFHSMSRILLMSNCE